MGVALSPELEHLVRQYPPGPPVDRIWDEAIEQSYELPIARGHGTPDSPTERMIRLRDQLKGELAAFHERLHVEPYAGGDLTCGDGRRLWMVRVPLTLFPRRDQGFSRIECIVELHAESRDRAFRVVKLLPELRGELVGKLELGAKLDVETNTKLGARLAVPGVGVVVGTVATELYGKAEAGFSHALRRECVVSEIVNGTGGRWRLDDLTHTERVAAEGHQLALIVEVAAGGAPLHGVGLLHAYSDVRWLTSSLGSAWQSLKGRILEFFRRGAPIEAYGEWRDILPDR
jgi:hypothetical protein